MNVNTLTKSEKKPYGGCNRVMLTDNEWNALSQLYGEYLEMAIGILDFYIDAYEKEYNDHARIMCKGGWVWAKVMESAINEIRVKNEDHPEQTRTFRQMNITEQSRRLHTSIFDGYEFSSMDAPPLSRAYNDGLLF